MSPRGRHEHGQHAAGNEPQDQDWARTSDRHVWRAYKHGLMLTVTHVIGGGWQATIEGPGITERSPVAGTRLAAQEYADRVAGERPGGGS